MIYLQQLLLRETEFEATEIDTLLDRYLPEIGNPNPEIRDDYLYSIFHNLLSSKNLSNEKLGQITDKLLSPDYLFYDMTNENTDSVLKRSFTLLQIDTLLQRHLESPIYTKEALDTLFYQFTTYYQKEKILLGYHPLKGWIHTTAHGADVIRTLAKCQELDESMLIQLSMLAKRKFTQGQHAYDAHEDDRMSRAIISIMNQDKLTSAFWVDWVCLLETLEEDLPYEFIVRSKTNRKNLMRSLYFQLKKTGIYPDVLQKLTISLS